MPKHFLIVFVLCSFTVLISCGTKGALYIPEQRYPQKTPEETTKAPETKPLKAKPIKQPTIKE
jgi:predicted small lipoprotein YifL